MVAGLLLLLALQDPASPAKLLEELRSLPDAKAVSAALGKHVAAYSGIVAEPALAADCMVLEKDFFAGLEKAAILRSVPEGDPPVAVYLLDKAAGFQPPPGSVVLCSSADFEDEIGGVLVVCAGDASFSSVSSSFILAGGSVTASGFLRASYVHAEGSLAAREATGCSLLAPKGAAFTKKVSFCVFVNSPDLKTPSQRDNRHLGRRSLPPANRLEAEELLAAVEKKLSEAKTLRFRFQGRSSILEPLTWEGEAVLSGEGKARVEIQVRRGAAAETLLLLSDGEKTRDGQAAPAKLRERLVAILLGRGTHRAMLEGLFRGDFDRESWRTTMTGREVVGRGAAPGQIRIAAGRIGETTLSLGTLVVDPERRVPLASERTERDTYGSAFVIEERYSDFRFDEPVDDGLFR